MFLLFVPVGFWFFGKPFDGNTFLFSLTGLSAAYNGAWWYISLYYKMLFTAPVVYGILTGSYLCIGLAVAGFAVLRFLPVPSGRLLEPVVASFHPAFYLCFLMGFLLARFRIYELVGRLPLVLVRVLGVLLFFLMIADRVRLAVDASSAGMDYVFVPLFSFGFLQILGMLPAVCNRVFSFFGKYSTYIWLTHVFFYDHYTKPLVTASRVSAGIYLTLVVLSTLAALGLSRIESFLCDHCLTL